MGIAGIGFTTLKYNMNSLYTGFFKIMVDLPGLGGGLKLKSSNKAPPQDQACRVPSASRSSTASTADHAIAPLAADFQGQDSCNFTEPYGGFLK